MYRSTGEWLHRPSHPPSTSGYLAAKQRIKESRTAGPGQPKQSIIGLLAGPGCWGVLSPTSEWSISHERWSAGAAQQQSETNANLTRNSQSVPARSQRANVWCWTVGGRGGHLAAGLDGWRPSPTAARANHSLCRGSLPSRCPLRASPEMTKRGVGAQPLPLGRFGQSPLRRPAPGRTFRPAVFLHK